MVLAAVFLVVYSAEVIEDLAGPAARLPDLVITLIWIAFAVDYVVNLALARPRKRWFVTHVWELAIVALPMLRPLRLLRLLSLLAILHRTSVVAFRGRVGLYVVCSTVLLVLVAGVAELDAEQNAPGSNIHRIGDAWWWAFSTITTVGYGDYYPVTLAGRLVAVALMGCGVALLGSVTALLASWFVEQARAQAPSPSDITRGRTDAPTSGGPEVDLGAGGQQVERRKHARGRSD